MPPGVGLFDIRTYPDGKEREAESPVCGPAPVWMSQSQAAIDRMKDGERSPKLRSTSLGFHLHKLSLCKLFIRPEYHCLYQRWTGLLTEPTALLNDDRN